MSHISQKGWKMNWTEHLTLEKVWRQKIKILHGIITMFFVKIRNNTGNSWEHCLNFNYQNNKNKPTNGIFSWIMSMHYIRIRNNTRNLAQFLLHWLTFAKSGQITNARGFFFNFLVGRLLRHTENFSHFLVYFYNFLQYLFSLLIFNCA